MRRPILPVAGALAALFAGFSVARNHPTRERTEPPSRPPSSTFAQTVAATGLVESSTENISIGTPLAGLVVAVHVTPGQRVRDGEPLFELDTRQLAADRAVARRALDVARARLAVVTARRNDVARQLEFVERIRDKRAISEEELSRRRSAVETVGAEIAQMESEVAAAAARLAAVEVELERSVVRAPIDAEVLQVKVRAGEFAPAAPTEPPLVLLGRSRPLHVRVDIDEAESWRLRPGAPAVGHLRGNAELATPLAFVRIEPFVVPKRSLTGDSTERVDTRVLQVIYRVERDELPLYVGQQLDVFIEGAADPASGG